ncbi:long-chain-fatty-acid CoA ligase 5 domain protein [Cooperia oncophora]
MQILRPTIVSLVPRLLNKFHDHIHVQISKKNLIIRTLFAHAKEVKLRMLRDGIQRYDTIWDKLVFKKIHDQFGGRLRMLTTGGAPVIPSVMEFTRIAYGCPLMEGAYGCFSRLVQHYVRRLVKLVDVAEMNYFAAQDKGEVCFRGAAVMKGYFMDEELSKKTIDEEGWLHTGDIGEWQPNGSLKIIDRKNALFKLAQGDFVSPEQIEAVYLNSPLIEQIFITGMTTRSFLVGIAVVNMTILRTTIAGRSELAKYVSFADDELLSEADIRQFVLKELNQTAKSKKLQSIELIKEIHLTSEEFTAENGLVTPTLKLRRHLLKQRFEKEIEKMYNSIPTM